MRIENFDGTIGKEKLLAGVSHLVSLELLLVFRCHEQRVCLMTNQCRKMQSKEMTRDRLLRILFETWIQPHLCLYGSKNRLI